MDNEPTFENGTIDGKQSSVNRLAEANAIAQMKDLAAHMAGDEANEGNYAAAAELQDFAETEHTYLRHGLRYSGDPDTLTGPLTPGQVRCRVCRLDDRTRAASSPDDLLCNVCRAATPIRVAKARRTELGAAAERFFGLRDLEDDETAAGSAQRDLVGERVDALMKLADLIQGHPLPYALVNAAEASIREMEVRLVAPGAHELSDVAKEADRA